MSRDAVKHSLKRAGLIGALILGACATPPEADRTPEPNIPPSFGEGADPLADTRLYDWREIIADPDLRDLIETALDENRDLRLAAANVRQARAALSAAQAARQPAVTLTGGTIIGETFSDNPSMAALSAFNDSSSLLGSASYEVDLFGRLDSQSEAALQTYLSTIEGRRALEISLISSIAQTWLTLAADQELLALAESTAQSQSQSLELTQALFDNGVSTGLDLRRASASVETARAQAAQFRALVRQDLNALRLLVGAPLPEDIAEKAGRDAPAVNLTRRPGIDSVILLQRPDVRAAEYDLLAARANIDAARAAYLPSISLTGQAGYASADLDDLLDIASGGLAFGPSVSLPIFDGGRLDANLESAQAVRDAALARYEGAIQIGFREVADALAVAETIDEQIAALTRLSDDTGQTLYLSQERFRSGIDNYLSVLDAQRSDYQARQQLISARLVQAQNIVAFYRALGAPPSPPADTQAAEDISDARD